VLVAGIQLDSETVAELVRMLRDECYFKAADTLDRALTDGDSAVGLTIRERTAVPYVLDDPSEELAQLRGVLMAEHEGRLRMGLFAGRVH
jgi:hypothetical protein